MKDVQEIRWKEKNEKNSVSSNRQKEGKLLEKNNQGITLIALVVTIVVMLILAGITIQTTLGDGGIINLANKAKDQQLIQTYKDRIGIIGINWSLNRALDDSVTVDDLWQDMQDSKIIENKETDVEKVDENGNYIITVPEGYKFQIHINEYDDVEVDYIGKEDKLLPYINEIKVISQTTNSVELQVSVSRLNGGSLNYYYKIKEAPDEDYQLLKGDTTELTASISGLTDKTTYEIKVEASNENGRTEKEIEVLIGELKGTIRQKGETVWNNGTATIYLETDVANAEILYQVNTIGEVYKPYKDEEGITGLKYGDTLFAVLSDGTNITDYTSIDVKEDLEPQIAQITLSSQTAKEGESITATVTHTDKESGVAITNCKWVYNTTNTPIGTEEGSYTGGSFSSNGQTINLTATTAGTYYLHVLTVDIAGNKTESISNAVTVEKKVVADGSFSEEKGVNTPDLAGGALTPIKWVNGNPVETTADDPEWYDYSTTAKKWANAITSDGSMWVWIPRYAYQISSNYHTNSTSGGTINIKFMKGTTNEAADGTKTWSNSSGQGNWNIHPGFNYSSTASGLWVAKFEASRNNATASSVGSGNTIKIQPGVQSWRSITVNDIYTTCLNYAGTTLGKANLNSHMMKNTEWGACAYLAQSSYGKNAKVWINPNSNFITGQAGSSGSASSTTSTSKYNSGNGPQASTTGNVYGVYDMNGGTMELVAAYLANSPNIRYGTSLVNGADYTKDVYTGSGINESEYYEANANVYGDAIYETSIYGNNRDQAWYKATSYYPGWTEPFFLRGGAYSDGNRANLFAFDGRDGDAYEYDGFRPVLIVL